MKKLLSLMTLVCVAVSFYGCSDDDNDIVGGPLPYSIYVQIVSADDQQNLLDDATPDYIPLSKIKTARSGFWWKNVASEAPTNWYKELINEGLAYLVSETYLLDGYDVTFPLICLDTYSGRETATHINSIKIDDREYTIKTVNTCSGDMRTGTNISIDRHLYLDDVEIELANEGGTEIVLIVTIEIPRTSEKS